MRLFVSCYFMFLFWLNSTCVNMQHAYEKKIKKFLEVFLNILLIWKSKENPLSENPIFMYIFTCGQNHSNHKKSYKTKFSLSVYVLKVSRQFSYFNLCTTKSGKHHKKINQLFKSLFADLMWALKFETKWLLVESGNM